MDSLACRCCAALQMIAILVARGRHIAQLSKLYGERTVHAHVVLDLSLTSQQQPPVPAALTSSRLQAAANLNAAMLGLQVLNHSEGRFVYERLLH